MTSAKPGFLRVVESTRGVGSLPTRPLAQVPWCRVRVGCVSVEVVWVESGVRYEWRGVRVAVVLSEVICGCGWGVLEDYQR
jgi:hypothetical protein